MKKNFFKRLNERLFRVFVFSAIILVSQATAAELVNPFLKDGCWYKAALHVHTTASDGDVNLPERIRQYMEKGYDVVAVTDHWKTNKIDKFSDEKFLVINGMEAHPRGNHFVCLNLPEGFEIKKDLEPQQVINVVNDVGGCVIYGHPYWLGHNINDMTSVNGYVAIEVYNGTCDVGISKGCSSVHWDQLLVKGHILPAVAVDDIHTSRDINLGWTMIKAGGLNTKEIMNSLKTGCYYASCGPEIKKYSVENGVVRIECSPVSKIIFAGQGSYGCVFRSQNNKLLTTAEWKLPEECKFIRAEVIDANNNYAWTNPVVLE
ncbi:MAG: CehA/McbA family metallohydrolase [Phycisphaerales bacterium]